MTILVYPHGAGRGGELLWSLRSVAAWADPADLDIIIAGHVPPWLDTTKATGLVVRQWPNRAMLNVWNALEAAANAVGDAPFALMNDDFFATGPIDWSTARHRGSADDHIEEMRAFPSRAPWRSRLRRSVVLARNAGIAEPNSWETHVPLPTSGAAVRTVAAALAGASLAPSVVAQRTLLAELAGAAGAVATDPKLYDGTYTGVLPSPWMSTAPTAWHGRPGEAIRGSFTSRSPWERGDDGPGAPLPGARAPELPPSTGQAPRGA